MAAAGLSYSGLSPDEQLVEIAERPDHPFFIGVQFHPELKSRPGRPHPLFKGFVAAAKRHGKQGQPDGQGERSDREKAGRS